MSKEAEGLAGCLLVPALFAFLFYAFSPSRKTKEAVAEGVRQDRLIFAAQDQVRGELRDPGSAEFIDVSVPHDGTTVVCGRVNSRNGFGGMGGAQRFITSGGSIFLEEQQEAVLPGQFDEFWHTMCGYGQ